LLVFINGMMYVARRRTELEIYLDVLMSVKECEQDIADGVTGSKPTRIMYASNLSWDPCMRKLDVLAEQGLVEEIAYKVHKTTRIYKLTDEGEEMITQFGRTRRSKHSEYDKRYKNALKELDLILGNSVEKITE